MGCGGAARLPPRVVQWASMFPPGDILIGARAIESRVRELADRLAADLGADLAHEGAGLDTTDRVVMIPVLAGAFVFFADLVRRLPATMTMEPVVVRSRPGAATESLGATLLGAFPDNLAGKHVVLVDDILDTGRTLDLLKQKIAAQAPASLRLCVLLRKERTREVAIDADLVGFDIPDYFVVGYGLDYDGRYRNLPDIRVLDNGRPDG